MPENLSSNGVAGRLAKPPDGGLLRQHTDESGAQDRSTLGSAHHGIVRKRRVHEHDGDLLQQILDEVDSDDERVAHSAKVIAQVASNVEESDVDISTNRAPANLPVTSHQEPSSTAKLHRKKKKFFLTQEADLALLKEILSVEPYAAEHGDKASRYQLVAENLSEHLEAELQDRTVKGRLKLLLAEFKREDQSYRKKSGVSEVYSEHKRLLQDIKDRIQEVQDAKTAKKQKKSKKAAALQTQGEILREQAVRRRSVIIPSGATTVWNLKACTRLWPLYRASWPFPGRQIGRTVPSINPHTPCMMSGLFDEMA
ncbi:unnamed protein product [Phytophthora fragariaefolia]|uniref:Unnamed protein product n=1 Tax=Phytophthora fragariaefolia TaxID=1490495 RepID=A0A9W6YG69_9STRA|nr:unnamed protein product [Phytophthora fragariaefolia]